MTDLLAALQRSIDEARRKTSPPKPALHVRLRLPYERPPKELGGNARAHWRSEARAKAQVRNDVTTIARAAGLHRYKPGEVSHVRAQLVWAPGDNRKRDPDNLWKLAKISCDCIARGSSRFVGLDVVPDDSPAYFEKEKPLILPPPAPKGMWIDLWLTLGNPYSDGETA